MMLILLGWEPLAAASTQCPPASPNGLNLGRSCQQAESSGEMDCSYHGYNSQQRQACGTCRQPVMKWKGKFSELVQKYQTKDQGLFGLFGGQATTAGNTLGSNNLQSFQKSNQANDSARTGQAKRASNANDAKNDFQSCIDEIAKACDGVQLDRNSDGKVANAVQGACEQGKKDSGEFADQKTKDSNSFGDMGKLMDAAGKAMGMAGQLAQMMNKQGDQGASNPNSTIADNGGSTSPTPNGTNGTETSKEGSGTGASSPSVGFSMPSPAAASTAAPGDGGTAASSPVPARDLASTGSPLGTGGGSGAVGASGGGGGASGGSGGSNSTGASKPADAAADTKKDGDAYEISGGGGKAMVGLKPTKGDLDALADASLTPPPAALDGAPALPATGASAEGAAAPEDSNATDGESIFKRVRTKYSLLKGAGRL